MSDTAAWLGIVFETYYRDHQSWGVVHIVCADGNISDDCVHFCLDEAVLYDDALGEALARVLMAMSLSERHQFVTTHPNMSSTTDADDWAIEAARRA